MSFILPPLALPYRAVTRVRRALYRFGVFKSRTLPRPVISIGNRSFGGSGKTPAVIAISEALQAQGIKVAILTRGYGRDSGATAIVEGNDVGSFGDEPLLISRRVPEADVIVGADRFSSGLFYLTGHDCDVFILDDGFQHQQLRRDFNLVIEDSFASLLREGPAALRDADAILLRDRAAAPGGRPSFAVTLEATGVRQGEQFQAIDSLRSKRVLAFSGLARNRRFFDLLRESGAILVETMPFDDHHRYTDEDIKKIRRTAQLKNAELILTTEKDGVKISDLSIGVVVVTMKIDRESELVALITERLFGRSGKSENEADGSHS